MTKIIYATTNPGKFKEVATIFKHHQVEIFNPSDLGVKLDVDETGTTLEENALLKAKAYKIYFPDDIVIADDTGIAIKALQGEPGIKVRRWKGYQMDDEAIISYCLDRMKDVPDGHREAQFRTVLAVFAPGHDIVYFDGILKGEILLTPKGIREPGMPFWPIFYLPNLAMTLGEFHHMPVAYQLQHPTHREIAVSKFVKSSIFTQLNKS